MKEINFNLTLKFSDKITDDNDVREIAENIARAIISEVNTGTGIVPEFSDAYTTEVIVNSEIYDVNVHQIL